MKKTALTAILVTALVGGAAVAQQSGHAGHSQMGGMMKATPANPYPPAEMKMHEKMMGAIGSDASETWVRKMIEHHRGGVEMSQIVLRGTRDARSARWRRRPWRSSAATSTSCRPGSASIASGRNDG